MVAVRLLNQTTRTGSQLKATEGKSPGARLALLVNLDTIAGECTPQFEVCVPWTETLN